MRVEFGCCLNLQLARRFILKIPRLPRLRHERTPAERSRTRRRSESAHYALVGDGWSRIAGSTRRKAGARRDRLSTAERSQQAIRVAMAAIRSRADRPDIPRRILTRNAPCNLLASGEIAALFHSRRQLARRRLGRMVFFLGRSTDVRGAGRRGNHRDGQPKQQHARPRSPARPSRQLPGMKYWRLGSSRTREHGRQSVNGSDRRPSWFLSVANTRRNRFLFHKPPDRQGQRSRRSRHFRPSASTDQESSAPFTSRNANPRMAPPRIFAREPVASAGGARWRVSDPLDKIGPVLRPALLE